MATSDHRFGKEYRLLTARDYRRVFDRARKHTSSMFVVSVRPNPGARPRLGIAVPRRCVRRAAERNRIKRIVREHFRRYKNRLGALDMVFVARAGVAEQPAREIGEQIDRLLEGIAACNGS